MKRILKELLLIVIAVLPIIYLSQIWDSLPQTIPTHYGLDGQADKFGDKGMLLWFVPTVMLLAYLLFLLAPAIDPKKRLSHASRSFVTLRFLFGLMISVIIGSYLATLSGIAHFGQVFPLIILVFPVALGNMLPTIKPNYFIGIRTPSTLENQDVWNKTHRFSGKLWVALGLLGIASYGIGYGSLPAYLALAIFLVAIGGSVFYSYALYRKLSAKGTA